MSRVSIAASAIIATLSLACAPLQAVSLYSSGGKIWDTNSANWGNAPGVYSGSTWNNATPDSAFFEGTAGTVTLGEAITNLNLNISVNSYTITGNTLNFVAGGTIANTGVNVSILSGITGSPAVTANQGSNQKLFFAPTAGTVALGAVSGNGSIVELAGSTSGNSIASDSGGKLNVNCSGDWTLTGEASAYEHYLNGGDLIVSGAGQLKSNSRAFKIYGGTLHYNTPAAVYDNGNNIPGSWNDGNRIAFNGGDLDNTSGSAITASTHPDMSLLSDFTFIGSLGTNSDLNLGSSIVHLNSDGRQITVSNAASTLTIGGAVVDKGSAYSLTKAGAGTLELTGVSTYTGDTIVNAGTLSISSAYLSSIAAVRIADGAVLDLGFVGTNKVFAVYTNSVIGPLGTWGAPGSGADHETALISGTGQLNVPAPTALDGVRYWDGGPSNIVSNGDSLSAGDSGPWSTSTKNWDAGSGVAHTNWNNDASDLAVFRGAAGTVTLVEDINLGALRIESEGYSIASNTLHFAAGGSITSTVKNVTIASGITGEPTVHATQGANDRLTFAPMDASVSLGALSGSGLIEFGGSTASNTIASMGGNKGRWNGSGRWTLNGNAAAYEHFISSGTLIVNGRLQCNNRNLHFSGGTLVANGTVAVNGGNIINMAAGATLKGTGLINDGDLPTVPAGATIAPGDPTGTLTLTNGNCTINGTLAIELDAGQVPQVSTLAVDPAYTLDISNATLLINTTGYPGSGKYVIVTHGAGKRVGDTFASVTWVGDVPSSAQVDYTHNSGTAIAIVVSTPGVILIVR